MDYNNYNEPVIQIVSRSSDDVRDNLIKAFYQRLGSSSWCKIVFAQDVVNHDNGEGFKRIIITPIPDSKLKEEAEIMLEQVRVYDEWKVLPG